MRSFTPRMIYKWFETHGVPLKTEKDGRVFPTSDNGKDIVKIFETMFQEHSIDLHMREGVVELAKANATFIITTNKAEYSADIVIITTGGNAYAHTGSTGDGYAFARQC